GGADLVIGHHPHVLQGVESYKGKMIAYSLGNFCFGGNQNPRDKDTMIFRQTFTVTGSGVASDENYEIIPCSISSTSGRNNYQPTPAEGSEKQRIIDKIQKFSEGLGGTEMKTDASEAKNQTETESSIIL
ncbi:MAG: CapA family protein, partial [Candidatus Fimenecus sp.]